MSMITSMFGGGGDDASDAAKEGSELQAAGQREALEYLKQTERIPQAYREQATSQLGALYGLPGVGGGVPYGGYQPQQPMQQPQMSQQLPANANYMIQNPAYDPNQQNYMPGDAGYTQAVPQYIPAGQMPQQVQQQPQQGQAVQMQQQPGGEFNPMDKNAFVKSLMQDPFYQSMLDQGEQAVLRGASATGGLRSGTASENLAQNSQNVLQGYYNQQVQGLTGLAGMQSYAPEIAGQMSAIGQTLGQGLIGGAQSQQAGQQQGAGNLMGMANLGLQAYGSGMFSDLRLKENIAPAGERNGHKWHTWTWNKEAERLGFFGDSEGVIADEVAKTHPEVIGNSRGYLTVNYQMLGVN